MLAISMRVGACVGLRPPLPQPHSGLFEKLFDPLLEKFPGIITFPQKKCFLFCSDDTARLVEV